MPQIFDRLRTDGVPRERVSAYLTYVEKGVPRLAGFGTGVEHLTCYIAGLDRIEDARLFPKTPGDTRAI